MKFKKLKQAAFIHEEWVTKKNAEEKLRKKADEEERKLRQEAQHQVTHTLWSSKLSQQKTSIAGRTVS